MNPTSEFLATQEPQEKYLNSFYGLQHLILN